MFRVIFFGSSIHSLPTLTKLLSSDLIEVVACVTQPDRPVGRKQILTPTPVSDFAKKMNLVTIKPESNPEKPNLFKNPKEVVEKINKYNPDLLIVADFGQKIPQKAIKLAPYGGLNIHPSLLPKYRGAAPVEWAILNGEKETGVTILTLEKEFDQGKIVAQVKEIIKDTDTSEDLYKRLFEKGADLLIKILPDFLNKKIKLKPQDNSQASFAPRLKKEDGKIDWRKSPVEIERMIRAFSPWPGTFTYVQIKNALAATGQAKLKMKNLRLKILKAHLEKGKLVLDQIQLEGKKPVSYLEFKRGYPNFTFRSQGLTLEG